MLRHDTLLRRHTPCRCEGYFYDIFDERYFRRLPPYMPLRCRRRCRHAATSLPP